MNDQPTQPTVTYRVQVRMTNFRQVDIPTSSYANRAEIEAQAIAKARKEFGHVDYVEVSEVERVIE